MTSKIIWFLSSVDCLAFQQQNNVSEIRSASILKLNSGKAYIQSHVLCPSCVPEKVGCKLKWCKERNNGVGVCVIECSLTTDTKIKMRGQTIKKWCILERGIKAKRHKTEAMCIELCPIQRVNLLATDFFFQILVHTVFKM